MAVQLPWAGGRPGALQASGTWLPRAQCPGPEGPRAPPTSLGPPALAGSGPERFRPWAGPQRTWRASLEDWRAGVLGPTESSGDCPVRHCQPGPGSGRGTPSQTAASAVAPLPAPQEHGGWGGAACRRPEAWRTGASSWSPTPELGALQGQLAHPHRPLPEPPVQSPWVVSQMGKLRPWQNQGQENPPPQGYTRFTRGGGPWPSRFRTLGD